MRATVWLEGRPVLKVVRPGNDLLTALTRIVQDALGLTRFHLVMMEEEGQVQVVPC